MSKLKYEVENESNVEPYIVFLSSPLTALAKLLKRMNVRFKKIYEAQSKKIIEQLEVRFSLEQYTPFTKERKFFEGLLKAIKPEQWGGLGGGNGIDLGEYVMAEGWI